MPPHLNIGHIAGCVLPMSRRFHDGYDLWKLSFYSFLFSSFIPQKTPDLHLSSLSRSVGIFILMTCIYLDDGSLSGCT